MVVRQNVKIPLGISDSLLCIPWGFLIPVTSNKINVFVGQQGTSDADSLHCLEGGIFSFSDVPCLFLCLTMKINLRLMNSG